jgi:hypothetical protein
MLSPVFRAIGTDHHVDTNEVEAEVGFHPHTASMWQLYQRAFDGFCESRLDPMCHRFESPVRSIGCLTMDEADPILVIGAGPSAVQSLSALSRVRPRLRLFTSPRGAALLAQARLVPDVVLVEHRTALDAHHTARTHLDGGSDPLAAVPLVAVDWRTPRSLVANVPPDRLFVPDPLPTWGHWPATAVALAMQAGATRIGLLGIDIGTTAAPDPAFEPLRSLLELLGSISSASTMDCGPLGARKASWPVQPLESLVAPFDLFPVGVARRAAPTIEQRRNTERNAFEQISSKVTSARKILTAASTQSTHLEPLVDEVMSWRDDHFLRVACQDVLGLSFLPRLWRSGIDRSLGPALWRPLVLALHEMVGQADRLGHVLGKRAA